MEIGQGEVFAEGEAAQGVGEVGIVEVAEVGSALTHVANDSPNSYRGIGFSDRGGRGGRGGGRGGDRGGFRARGRGGDRGRGGGRGGKPGAKGGQKVIVVRTNLLPASYEQF